MKKTFLLIIAAMVAMTTILVSSCQKEKDQPGIAVDFTLPHYQIFAGGLTIRDQFSVGTMGVRDGHCLIGPDQIKFFKSGVANLTFDLFIRRDSLMTTKFVVNDVNLRQSASLTYDLSDITKWKKVDETQNNQSN